MNRLQSLRTKLTKVLTIIPAALLLGLGAVGTLAPQQAYAASSSVPEYIPSTGTDFWLTYMYNYDRNNSDVRLKLYAIPEAATTIKVFDADGNLLTSESVAADAEFVYEVPRAKAYTTTSGEKSKTGIHVTSTDANIALYASDQYDNGSDRSYDMTPVVAKYTKENPDESTLGTEYVVQTFFRGLLNSEFAFVATEDGTDVTVHFTDSVRIPSSDPGKDYDIYEKGSVHTFENMKAGEVYQFWGLNAGNPNYYNLSGTIITSTKPIAVFNGGIKSTVPYKPGANGDITMEQSIPVSSWGRRFVAMEMSGFPERDEELVSSYGHTYYIATAIYPGTEIKVNGVTKYTLNAGESTPNNGTQAIRCKYDDKPSYIESNKPIIIYGYMCNNVENVYGIDEEGVSEPSVALIPDVTKGAKRVAMYCPSSPMNTHYANVVVAKDKASSMKLDGASAGEFTELAGTPYAYARVNLHSGVNILTNDDAPFVAVQYSVKVGEALSETGATVFNLAPDAPKLYVNDELMSHGEKRDFCNKHPGVKFRAEIDYPHDTVIWDLGENDKDTVVATTSSYATKHEYGKTVNDGDTTHTVRLAVIHYSPIKKIRSVDSIRVSLVVHPVYYDTLRIKVPAWKHSYTWDSTAYNPFKSKRAEYQNMRLKLEGGVEHTDSINKGKVGGRAPLYTYNWTSDFEDKTIKDSLIYETLKYGCDSIFVLHLDVVPNVVDTAVDTLCQGFTPADTLVWTGHHYKQNGVQHNLSCNGVQLNTIKLDVAGDFIIRDSMVVKFKPYAEAKYYEKKDSIWVLKLHINPKPTITLTAPDPICQTDDNEVSVEYVPTDTKEFTYWLKDGDDVKATGTITVADTPSPFTISGLSGLDAKTYKLTAQATSDKSCISDICDPVDVVVNVKPTLTDLAWVDGKSAWCYPADSFVIKYNQTNAKYIHYRVTKGENEVRDWWSVPYESSKKDTIFSKEVSPLKYWADGVYTLYAFAESDKGCHSDTSSIDFTISKQPKITITSVDNACDQDATTEVKIKMEDGARKYKYRYTGATSTVWSDPVSVDADGDYTFNLNISAISGLTAETEYTLHMVANSADPAACPSDTVTATFKVYPMPSASITSKASDLNRCVMPYEDIEVNYSSSVATTQIKWELTRPGGAAKIVKKEPKGASLTLLKDDLKAAGTYTLLIDSVWSTHCDSTGLKKNGSITFEIYDTAHITLSDISPVCAGEAVANNAYTASSIKSFKYWVDTVAGATPTRIAAVTVNSDATSGSINMAATAGLPAGSYMLRVQATANNTCGEASVISKPFTIHPIPTITPEAVTISNDKLCEGVTALPYLTIPGTADSIIVEVKKDGNPHFAPKAFKKPANNQISLAEIGMSAPAGSYAVTITPKSGTTPACTGDPYATAIGFTVFKLPTVKLTPKGTLCQTDDDKLTVEYTTENAAKRFTYELKKGSESRSGEVNPASASGEFTIEGLSTLSAGTYKLKATVYSANCENTSSEVDVVINPKPTITALAMASGNTGKCKSDAGAFTVTYNHTDANTVCYKVMRVDVDPATEKQGWTDAAVTEGKTFEITTTSWEPGTYSVEAYVKTDAGCKSASFATKPQFIIHPMTTLTLNPEALDLNTIQGTPSISVPYTSSEELSKYEFTFVNKTDASIHATPGTINNPGKTGSIAITTGALPAGDYRLTVKATTKTGGCETTQTLDIKIFYPTSVTITELSKTEFCEGEDKIHVKIKTNYSNQYKFEVQKGGTRVYPTTEPAWTDLTNATIDGTERTEEFDLTTSSLPDGSCTLIVSVRNKDVTGSEKSTTQDFTVNPKPVVVLAKDSVCHGYNRTITFGEGTTNVAKVTYRLEPAAIAETTVTISNNQLPLATAELPVGTYTLYVKPISGKDCEGTEVNAQFAVNAIPTISVDQASTEQVCDDGAKLRVAYNASYPGARTYTCSLWNEDYTSEVKTPGGNITSATGTIDIPTTTLTPANYHIVLQTVSGSGCPSKPDTANFTIKRTYLAPLVTNASICHGEKFDWEVEDCNGKKVYLVKGLTESTHQLDTLDCDNKQCNPTYELYLTVWPEYAKQDDPETICADSTLSWRGREITKAGKYADTVPGVAPNGCDSIYRIDVSQVTPKTTISSESAFYCYGKPVKSKLGKEYKNLESGSHVICDTLRDEGGTKCDTAYYILNVEVGKHYYDSASVSSCGKYTWAVNGVTYDHSGIYRKEFTTVEGCENDSVFVLNLTVNEPFEMSEVYDILETQLPYSVHGYTFTEAGTYDCAFTTKAGCDSIYHVTINTSPLPRDTMEVTRCDNQLPYTWERLGKNYGEYSIPGYHQKMTEEKDSIHVLHLTVNKTWHSTMEKTACESYTWHGTDYTASGTYTWPGKTSCDCDSVEVLNLTIEHNEVLDPEDVTVCYGEYRKIGDKTKVWEANESFDVTETRPSGCTTKKTYNVTVVSRDLKAAETYSFCAGTSYEWVVPASGRTLTYTAGGTYYDTIFNGSVAATSGCPTTISTLVLKEKPSYKIDEPDVEIREDLLPFTWKGHKDHTGLKDTLLYAEGHYYDNLTSAVSGCDSIHHIFLKVGFVERDTDYVPLRVCESVVWGKHPAKTYTESCLASDTVWYSKGGKMTYDSIYFQYIEVYKPYVKEEDAFTVCQNTPFEWHGKTYTCVIAGDSLMEHKAHSEFTGCDSTFTRTVHVVEVLHKEETVTVCPNELPYKWAGHKADTLLRTSGTYTDAHKSVYGCDSTYVLNFTVKTVVAPANIEATICKDKTYTWKKGGETLLTIKGTEVGTKEYYNNYTDNGCPVRDTLTLTVTPPATPTVTDATICHGEKYDWVVKGCDGVTDETLMRGLTETTHQVITLKCEGDECNPVYELILTVNPKALAPVEKHMLCANQTLTLPDGQLITKAGSYEYKTDDGAGCFIYHPVEVSQIIPEVKTINQTVCYGTPVVFNGHTYSGLNVGKHELRDTIASADGCDSVYVQMNLTVGERYYDSISVTECDSYLWHGTTYTQSGVYREELASVNGCDSIAVLNLTINKSYSFIETYDILDTQLPFTVHEFTYEAAGTYDRTFTTVAGCDSTYHLTINVHTEPLPKDTVEHTMCEGETYTWQGADYTASGWYSKTEPGVAIHVLHLIVNPKYSNTTYVHHCGDSYMWQGTPRTASGTYTWNGSSLVTGCDSTEVLVLTLGKANSKTVDVYACRYEPVNVGSKTFMATEASYPVMQETFTNASGCDSTVTYKITVTDREAGTKTSASFCEGGTYSWHGKDYSIAATYYDTTFNGTCVKTIDTLVLTAKPQYRFDEDVEVWENALPYAWVGHKGDTLLQTNGDYYDNLTSLVSGCDSIHHIHFHVNWYERDTTNTEVNPDLGCGSVTWKDKPYTESCLASDTAGNTIEYRYIVVTNQYSVVEPAFTICRNEAFSWHDQNYEANHFTAGDHLLTYTRPLKYNGQTVAGCDSTFTATVHVVETFFSEISKEVCPNELPYLWRDKQLNAAGDYTDVVPSPTGCDSTFVLHLALKAVTGPQEKNDIICQGSTYEWLESGTKLLDIPANEPGEFTYYHWYNPNAGTCPDYKTYYKLNLTVGKNYNEDPELHLDSALTKHICHGESFEWFGETRKVEGADVVQINDHMFMKNFHYEKPSVDGCDSLIADLTLVARKKYERTIEEDTTICNLYIWDGETVTTEGDEITYTRTYHLYPELGECGDSILTRKFNVLHSEVQTIDKDTCDEFFWDKTGLLYTESGTYIHNVPQLGGLCDKIYTLNLNIRKKGVKDIDKEACYSYVWTTEDGGDGRTCDHTDTYEYKLDIPSVSGCDSIHYLHLTVKDSVVKWLDPVEACDSYEWKGTTYTSSRIFREVSEGSNGCDSITWMKLTIKHSSPVTNIDTTACRRYDDSEHGIHLDESNAGENNFSFTYENAEGCDSVVNIKVTITTPDTVEHTFKACDSFTWNEVTYTEIGTYDKYQDFATHNDCSLDPVILLHLTIGANVATEITKAEWSPFIWEGDTYTESGTYTKTLEAACGCDSVVTLHLTINDPESDEETQFACQSYPWPWAEGAQLAGGYTGLTTFTESGDYEVKWINHPDVGHDSIRILHLTIKEPEKIVTTVKECDSYTWEARGFKQTYTESGVYENLYDDGVCVNVDSLYLTISLTPLPVEYYDTACDVLTVNGNSYFNSIDFTENLKTVNDCDSAVNYHLKINKRKTQTVSEQACGSYLWEATGVTYTQSGSYTKVMETADGCDSVVTLNLSIYEPYNYSFSACGKFAVDGTKQYIWDNRTYTEAGDYSWTYQSVRGCDSIVTLHLTMPVDGIDNPEQVTACDEYLWHGRLLTASGAYSDTISSLVTGCDSVAWLFLTIAEHPTGEETREVSSPTYTWGNVIYYESGDYERRFPMEDGRCDSIVTLHLTFTNPLPISTEFSATACDAYTWDSETFYESGVYVRNFPTLDGRDSIVKLTLTINRDTTVYKTDKLCGPYDWNGQTLTETGVYTQVLQRASGCDSVVTLTLTLCERFETSFVIEARDVYVWDDQTYTESTTETRQYTSRQGCDSLVTMVLTIVKTANTVDNAEACTQYAWADSIFTESTIHSHVFPASTGGDSVVTMTLIIHEPVYTDLVDTVREPQCSTPGYEYTLPWGETVQHTGIYTDTLESAVTGCDSIVRFHLQWCDEELCIDTLPVIAVEQCGPYTWDKTGMTYSTTGTYDYHERAGDGCEYVSLLRLTILPEAYRTIDTTACDSLYWEEKSIWIKESGYYRDTVFGGAADGCDSITIRHAIIGHAAEETIEVTSCDAYTLNGETFNESGTYIQHLTTVTGCDSTLTINLTLNPSKDSTLRGVACDDTVWNGVTLTKTGFYPMVVQAEGTGCDSVVTLQLIIYGSKDITYIDSTQCDSIKWGPDREGNDTIIYDDGIYTRTFLSSVGCDSTVTMDLRLKHHDLVQAPDTQACDSFVWNDKVYFESGTFKDTTLSTRTGCDSITTMRITINPTLYDTIYDTVPPPFYLWPTESDTIWVSGEYVDTTASLITGCDSITTLYLVMTDSIILDSIEPVRIDTLGYCPGDTVNLIYNLLKGHPTKYTLIFDTVAPRVPDYTRDFKSVLDTTELPNHGMDTLFTLVIPEYCEPGEYEFDLQMFDDYSSSKVYHYHLFVAVKGEVVSLWTDVVAIDNHEEKYIGYQWYINRDQSSDNYELIPGATKQYYSDGEDLNACYRAKLQLADSSWVYTCETCFDLRSDSLELIAYPTPAPVGQPVTIKAMGILLEKLVGSTLTITKESGLKVDEFKLAEGQRSVDVTLTSGMYIATLVTGDADDRVRTANVKFIVF